MKLASLVAAFTVAVSAFSGSAHAQQSASPTYQADPSVYKLLFEDQNFRVIEAVRKAGQQDKVHSHPVVSVVYFVSDCNDELSDANGNKRGSVHKAGEVVAVPVIPSHSTKNVSAQDCRQIFIERK